MGKRRRLRKHKESYSRVWKETKYKSEEVRKVRYGKRKRL